MKRNVSDLEKENGRLAVIFIREWVYWLGGALVSYVLANYLIFGLDSLFIPDLSVPIIYRDDGLFHSLMIQRVIEGWIYNNERMGYPFGSSLLDYPGSDSANHLLLKILGLASGSFQAAMNLYFILGFPVVFIGSYGAFRYFGLTVTLSLLGGFIFSFQPFHFLREVHLFYTLYLQVPVFLMIGYSIYRNRYVNLTTSRLIYMFIFILCIVSFGVYYALFGAIILFVAGFSGSLFNKRFTPIKITFVFLVFIIASVVVNVAPTIKNNWSEGVNNELGHNNSISAEIYGLKFIQLIMPRLNHRNKYLSNISSTYNKNAPLQNENHTSSLGIIGSIGLIFLFIMVVLRISNVRIDTRLSFLSLCVYLLFMLGTIGGLGALLSKLFFPAIRGWNRISIFIGFISIAGILLLMQLALNRLITKKRGIVEGLIAITLFCIAIYDQTSDPCLDCYIKAKNDFNQDRKFISTIEKKLDFDAAIYQLPYMQFPESPPTNELGDYQLAIGYLHSKELRWSYGGMKGRSGDGFFRALSQESVTKQIEVIKNLGFSGIYIDRRGYPDNGNEIISQISAVLHEPPTVKHEGGNIVFYKLDNDRDLIKTGTNNYEIMKLAGYYADNLGARYPSDLKHGVDFSNPLWPSTIKDVTGISGLEPWGRWSDGAKVVFSFFNYLPKKFDLILDVTAFGPNNGEYMTIKIGKTKYSLLLPSGHGVINVNVVTDGTEDSIELYPPFPISPAQLGQSGDDRKLGVGFKTMFIEDKS
jgi:phosphoglycerol transferase